MSAACPNDWKQCHRGYCSRKMRCAERAASEPASKAPDIAGLKLVAEVEKKSREAFDNHFHKVAASMTYDQWRVAFKVGFRFGHAGATAEWADHLTDSGKAISAFDPWRADKDAQMNPATDGDPGFF